MQGTYLDKEQHIISLILASKIKEKPNAVARLLWHSSARLLLRKEDNNSFDVIRMAVNLQGIRRNIKNVAHNYTDAQVRDWL